MIYTRVIIFLSFALLFFMLGKGCGDKSQQAQADIDALRDSIMMYKVQAGYLGVELNKAERVISELMAVRHKAEKSLSEKEAVIARQQAKIKALSSAVVLAPSVSKDCDSLAVTAVKLSEEVDKYKVAVSRIQENADSIIIIKSAALVVCKSQLKECNDVVSHIDKKLPEIKKEVKARNQYYVGGFVFGNANTMIQGAGIDGTMVSKRGQMYDAGVMLSRGQAYLMAGMKLRLSIKK